MTKPSTAGFWAGRPPRVGEPSTIWSVRRCSSPPASDYVNGQVLFIDGGMTAVV